MITCNRCNNCYDKTQFIKGKICKSCQKEYRKTYKEKISKNRKEISIKKCTKCLEEKDI